MAGVIGRARQPYPSLLGRWRHAHGPASPVYQASCGSFFHASSGSRSFAESCAPGAGVANRTQQTGGSRLQGVKHIVCVASGKGGVGKSSIAVNLGYLLAQRPGTSVGILDADIYGPSLPLLLPAQVDGVNKSEAGGIEPIVYKGVKVMSMGYLRPGEHAAIRGPMVSAMIQQLLTQTEWGQLDYLIIDMPPGTGDIHLTVAQNAEVDGAVVVSTPQVLAIADVEKGISMFNAVKIPTIAVVENMSSFICGGCSLESALFDTPGRARAVAERFGVPSYTQLPVDPSLSGAQLGSDPFVLNPELLERPLARRLQELADSVATELAALRQVAERHTLRAGRDAASGGPPILQLKISSSAKGDERRVIEARAARLACRSAAMWDEFTGEKRFREEDIPLDVYATKIIPAGTYAVNINWSDGHSSLMPYAVLKSLPALESE